MQLSKEWLDFLATLNKYGPVDLDAFPDFFGDRRRAERLLGEIIRQGLVDLDEYMKKIVITEKGRSVLNTPSI